MFDSSMSGYLARKSKHTIAQSQMKPVESNVRFWPNADIQINKLMSGLGRTRKRKHDAKIRH